MAKAWKGEARKEENQVGLHLQLVGMSALENRPFTVAQG